MSRYALTSLGPAEKLGAAQLPIRARGAADYASRGIIDGSPGTQAMPAPRPAAVPQDKVPLAIGGGYHRSSQAPQFWYPGVYYERPGPGGYEHAPVSVLSDNQMPMPAIDPLGRPSVSMGRPRLGGQYQVTGHKAVPMYLNMGGGQ